MSAEDMPNIDETNKQLDRALWREMRKPLAASAIAAMSFFVGNHIDNSHQAHANELSAEFQTDYGALSAGDQAVVDAYLSGDELPEGTAKQLADEAHKLGDISEEQRQEEDAGGLWTFAGQIASLYAGVKLVGVGLGRMLGRDEIKRRHPDLAPERVKGRARDLVVDGGFVEEDDKRDEKYGWGNSDHTLYFKGHLREVGYDIEASERFTQNREGLDQLLLEMLNDAQWDGLAREIRDEEDGHLGSIEALQIRIANDLWKPTETFRSVKDWYNYRRRQVVQPGAFHRVSEQELFLPELERIDGGIGVAVSRVAQYLRTWTDNRRTDRDQASEAMVFATEGAAILDKLAPRDDGSHWFDYVEALAKGVDLTKSH